VIYDCGDRSVLILGSRVIADHLTEAPYTAVVEPYSGVAAVLDRLQLQLFDGAGHLVAAVPKSERDVTAVGFLDAEHLVVADLAAVWAWTPATKAWRKLFDFPEARGLNVASGAIFVGRKDNALLKYVDGKLTGELALGGQPTAITASADGRWLAASLLDGSVQLVDAKAGALAARLEPLPGTWAPAVLDVRGDLVARIGARGLSLWDRRTGDLLVGNLDYLKLIGAAWFRADGQLDILDRTPGHLELHLDQRPLAAILDDIACHVPLRATGTRLEPTTPSCHPTTR
jgi:hypothetical protein